MGPGPKWANGPKCVPSPIGPMGPKGSQAQVGQWAQIGKFAQWALGLIGPVAPMGPNRNRFGRDNHPSVGGWDRQISVKIQFRFERYWDFGLWSAGNGSSRDSVKFPIMRRPGCFLVIHLATTHLFPGTFCGID